MAKATSLADLLAYQEGAVVSRVVLFEEKGNITVFAFDKGEGLSEHSAPFDALAYIMEGKAQITISGTPHIVAAGEFIIMPADEPHALKALEKFKMTLVMIRS